MREWLSQIFIIVLLIEKKKCYIINKLRSSYKIIMEFVVLLFFNNYKSAINAQALERYCKLETLAMVIIWENKKPL